MSGLTFDKSFNPSGIQFSPEQNKSLSQMLSKLTWSWEMSWVYEHENNRAPVSPAQSYFGFRGWKMPLKIS